MKYAANYFIFNIAYTCRFSSKVKLTTLRSNEMAVQPFYSDANYL
jgi:hypothetical protein